jgi:poly-beta-1,6-N-acetyl-D-glucosamine biosynthesis protein PgaD
MGEIEIFDNPRLKSFWRQITEGGVTGLMWAGWIYLFLPLVNLVLWYLGIRIFYVRVIQTTGYHEFMELMTRMGWAVVIIFLVLRVWGYYNFFRFGKKNRRTRITADLQQEKMAAFFQLPPEEIKTLQARKESVWPLGEEPLSDVRRWLEERTSSGLTGTS